ncbi:MAG: DUF1840 domain-containing protein [Azoarcus sp.]|jgi:hypothetical protein|nr:DUF1840 domain-containing protein [Azoarcus sp.]
MLITFKSKAGADVLMLGKAASQLIEILGKDAADGKGIITVEQLPRAIARLQTAIAKEREQLAAQSAEERDAEEETAREEGRTGMNAAVNLTQRAWPLLDLLQRAQAEREPVVWGV